MAWAQMVNMTRSACQKTFGEMVLYSYKNQKDLEIRGIFNESYVSLDADGAPISAAQPVVEINGADLPGKPKENDNLFVSGRRWRVDDVHLKTEGDYLIFLKKL
ncbi:MAG: hypothetical protein COB04_16085 [Gammaproteobacteria bacterium]|nr:MAG: hypothetical protein COB04_16085 [Gammaproteobacteria bacterium]